eukprot:4100793-Prymnesium_polylepis.1
MRATPDTWSVRQPIWVRATRAALRTCFRVDSTLMEVSRTLEDRLKELLSDHSDSIPVGSMSHTVVLGGHGNEGRDAVLVDAHVVDDP